ncbi:MAG: amino acid ABC transporter permease [Oscillospiraceae bacterium]|nr:amino acid ABC transporter permease [Oscillospiraceae bacterium]
MEKLFQLGADIAKLWERYASSYLGGMWSTIVLAVLCTLVGCLIGLLCGVMQTIPSSPRDNLLKRVFLYLVRGCVRIYVEVFRGTPMILQAVVIYYALPYFSDAQVKFTSVWLAAFVVVSINTGAYMAESVRGGIISIDPGQTEGAKAIGMTHWQTMTSVILPQALRNILPQIGNNLIINIKDTSVMSIIGFTEFFAIHKTVVGATYLYFPSAAIEMVGYLTMTVVASVLLRWAEKKMDGADSYELAQVDALTLSAGTYRLDKRPEDLMERNLESERGK